jgi:predicted deacylase
VKKRFSFPLIKKVSAFLLAASFVAGAPAAASKIKETTVELLPGTSYSTTAYIRQAPEPGPAVLISGGVHGNEPAGAAAAENITKWEIKKGTLIIIPRVNKLALRAGKRTLPEIGDVNRAYPGSALGNPSSKLAHAIGALMKEYKADMVIDIHEARDFNSVNPDSLGQTILYGFDDKSAILAMEAADYVNTKLKITDPKKKFTFLANPIVGSTAQYASSYLRKVAFTLETSVRQPLADRVEQHLAIVRYLLASCGMVES